MSEIQIWQPQAAEIAAYQPPSGPLDDWIRVADQVVRLAEVICRSPFVPDGLRNSVPATAAAILTGRELGIPPMTSLANIHVIHGKPGLSALVMRALVLGQGHEWEDVDVSNTRVMLRGRRKGSETWTTASFSTADAATAKLALGGYPQDKLYARASARLARRAFADVIAGMPYSIEELEDGMVPDEATDAGAAVPDSNGTPAVADKPRTAQRKARAQSPPPAATESPRSESGPTAAPRAEAAAAGGDLPPLPGEEDAPGPAAGEGPGLGAPDDTDYDTPGTATRGKGGQLTALWTVMSTEFGFTATDESKAQARTVCEHIINRDLVGGTTGNLSRNEARTVLDTLAHWQHQAQKEGREPRDYMLAVMVAQDAAGEDGDGA